MIASSFRGTGQFAISSTGTLIYVAGDILLTGMFLDWMDRNGKKERLRNVAAVYVDPGFSPDGRRLAVAIFDRRADVWVYEWERDIMSRLTFEGARNERPVWTPDGQRIVFRSERDSSAGGSDLYWTRADGTGEVERLTESPVGEVPFSWHPDGKFLAYEQRPSSGRPDVFILPMEGDEASGWRPGEPAPFLDKSYAERQPAFSTDGRWLAYTSDESGRNEIYVRPFPGPGGKWQISAGGGSFPTWSPNGKELFYLDADLRRIMVSTYAVEGETFRPAERRLWSDGQFLGGGGRRFALHPDGDRFAVLSLGEDEAPERRDKLTFIFNFFDELERLAPAE